MCTEYTREPTLTSEPTKAFSYNVTPGTMGSKSGGAQAGVGPGSKSVGGNSSQDFDPTNNYTDREDYDQKPMPKGGGRDYMNADVDDYNVLP
jgi:hypothetical protein